MRPVPRGVLSFGTSTEWCGVGLQWRDGAGRLRCDALLERAGQEHSRRALAMAAELLRAAGLALAEIDAIAFDAGPGSFTGLRIGCGIAQGLGFALARPVVPVVSLEALAVQCDAATALVALDARMGEVYCCAYALRGAVATALGPVQVLPPAQAARALLERLAVDGAVAAVGDACARHPVLARAMSERGVRLQCDPCARGDALAAIGWLRLLEGRALPAEQAAPIYVRDKVALDVDEQRRLRTLRSTAAAA
jgi:tRNA threonylcarbamoyladenosine biosynthesis protein TsaB